MSEITVQKSSLSSISKSDLNILYTLLVCAYAKTEKEIWGENYIRIELDEYKELIEKETVFSAKLNGSIVGTILLLNHGNHVFSFGLLAADFSKKGLGIGRRLIEAAEREAKNRGAVKMSLEILTAENKQILIKKRLSNWYQRLGYKKYKTVSFIEQKPDKLEKSKHLIIPSVFECYEKVLRQEL